MIVLLNIHILKKAAVMMLLQSSEKEQNTAGNQDSANWLVSLVTHTKGHLNYENVAALR